MGELAEQNKLQGNQIASVDNMMAMALKDDVGIDKLERLMALRDKVMIDMARKDYYKSMSQFQGECPSIKKTRKVMNKNGQSVRYVYANLDDIVQQTGGLIKKHGFSYMTSTEMKVTENGSLVCATVIVTHENGHSESTSFCVPVDTESYMNNQQQVKSANTFAMRVAFQNAFGIMTADEDDDAIQAGGQGPSALEIYRRAAEHAQAVRDHWDSVASIRSALAVEDYERAAEAYAELEREEIMKLWLAPTKGGIFTTEERATMKSDAFSAKLREYKSDEQTDVDKD